RARTRWPGRPAWRRSWVGTRRSWSACPAGATRTCRPPASGSGCCSPGRDRGVVRWAVDPRDCDQDRREGEGASMSVKVAFEKARAEGRAALVGYLPAGFPTVADGITAVRALASAG